MIEPLKRLIRDVPGFPKPGVLFKDFTPLLADPAGLAMAIELLANPWRGRGVELVVGAESRGFIVASAVAVALSAGLAPIRKPGKLPRSTHGVDYTLEYGKDRLELHADAVRAGQRVLVVDDLLATGGTLAACCELVTRARADIVGIGVLIELTSMRGRARVEPYGPVRSVLEYERLVQNPEREEEDTGQRPVPPEQVEF